MRCVRGFSLLEMSVAFGMLAIAIAVASVLVSDMERHQQVLWEDAIAGELATSALEQALAEPRLEPTGPDGRTLAVAPAPDGSPVLPELKVVLVIRNIPEQAGVVEVCAKADWLCVAVTPSGGHRTIERTTRRRATR